jgi:hypothetical protein
MKPRPVWWKVIIGLIIAFNAINKMLHRTAPPPNVNRDQFQGMQDMQIVILFLGLWLIWWGTKPLRKKPTA